jgi:RNA polymerase sigma factor (sigma-70 family)
MMYQPKQNDAALLEAIKLDDAIAFKELYDRYWEELYLKACRRVDKDEAKDLVQEVMTTLWKRRREIYVHDDGNIGRYLHTAVKYQIISYYAHTSTEIRNSGLFEVLSGHAFTNTVETKELGELIEKEIGRLPTRMQQIFRMSREEELSIADIARQLSLSVKNQLSEALKRIKASIRLHDSGDMAIILFLIYCSTQ